MKTNKPNLSNNTFQSKQKQVFRTIKSQKSSSVSLQIITSLITKVRQNFRKSHFTSPDYYNKICINNIIFNEKSSLVSQFKDYLIEDDNNEFLKRYYKYYESYNKLETIYDFYSKYILIHPNYTIINMSKYMMKNLKRKMKLINQEQLNRDYFNKESFQIIRNKSIILSNSIVNSINNQSEYTNIDPSFSNFIPKQKKPQPKGEILQLMKRINNKSANDILLLALDIEEYEGKSEKIVFVNQNNNLTNADKYKLLDEDLNLKQIKKNIVLSSGAFTKTRNRNIFNSETDKDKYNTTLRNLNTINSFSSLKSGNSLELNKSKNSNKILNKTKSMTIALSVNKKNSSSFLSISSKSNKNQNINIVNKNKSQFHIKIKENIDHSQKIRGTQTKFTDSDIKKDIIEKKNLTKTYNIVNINNIYNNPSNLNIIYETDTISSMKKRIVNNHSGGISNKIVNLNKRNSLQNKKLK